MKKMILVVAVVSVGCGVVADEIEKGVVVDCDQRQLVFWTAADVSVNVAALQHNVDLTADIVTGRLGVPAVPGLRYRSQVCDILKDTQLIIDRRTGFGYDEADWTVTKTHECDVVYDHDQGSAACAGGVTTMTLEGMRLRDNAAGYALLHEFLHVWDALHLSPGTASHERWETNGYLAADEYFSSRYMRLDKP